MRPRFAYSPGVQYDSIVMVLRPPSPMATTPSRRAVQSFRGPVAGPVTRPRAGALSSDQSASLPYYGSCAPSLRDHGH
mgnify:CR=1 FL=1